MGCRIMAIEVEKNGIIRPVYEQRQPGENMFTRSANFYDAIYAARGKDYEKETQYLVALIQAHKRSTGNRLLDIACGTGGHALYFQKYFHTEGLDLDPELLLLARQKTPNIVYHQGNMVDFALGRSYDVINCIASAIGYVKTLDHLQATLQNMQHHTAPGGLIIIEPWLSPQAFIPGKVFATFIDQPDLKVARMNVNEVIEGNISVIHFHYLIATPEGVEHFTERHELGLFTHQEYVSAFEQCGLRVIYDEKGLAGKGLFVCINPSE